MPELHVPGEMSEFFRHVGRSHEVMHDAEIEERWTAGRTHTEPAGVAYEKFRSSSAYDNWNKTTELDLTAYQTKSRDELNMLASFRDNEFKLKQPLLINELGGSTKPEVAEFIRGLRKGDGKSQGARALADEAKSIIAKRAGTPPPLGDDVLRYIADERAAVQRRGMYLSTHLDTLVTAAINEINTSLNRPHGDTRSESVGAVYDATTPVREALREWYAELDRLPFPGDEQRLFDRAKDLVYQLGELGRKSGEIAFNLRNRNPANAEPEAPLLKGGLELQAALMAREIGEQLATRLASSTFSAVYRIASERPGPPQGLGDTGKAMLESMRSNTDRAPFDWAHDVMKEVKAARKEGLDSSKAEVIGGTVQRVANALEAWMKALRAAPKNGPGEIRNIAGEAMRQIRVLDRLVAEAKVPAEYAAKLSELGDVAAAYIRSDARNAQNLLGG